MFISASQTTRLYGYLILRNYQSIEIESHACLMFVKASFIIPCQIVFNWGHHSIVAVCVRSQRAEVGNAIVW